MALSEKALPFELRTLSLSAKAHRQGDYAARTLTGRVPSLQQGELWLAESSAIEEYLEEAFPPPGHPRLYPLSLRDRARARQVQAWLRSDLAALRQERPTSSVFGRQSLPPLTPAAREAGEWGGARQRGAPGSGRELSVRRAFSIADADLALMVQRLVANGDPLAPRVKAWAEGIWRRPSVQGFVARARAAPPPA